MNATTTTLQIITNVEDMSSYFVEEHGQMAEHTTTIGYIVPAGTSLADAPVEAEDTISIPATEDEHDWLQGLRDALAGLGYAVEGGITQDGSIVTATVVAV